MLDSSRSENLSYLGVVAAIVPGLYFCSLYSYLLLHSLIEVITIGVAFTLFILTWNTHRYLPNNYLRMLGIGYAFVALIDLLHTFAYKGMNIFPDYGANLPTQLWIAARYLQAATLIAAPVLMERRVGNRAIFGGYSIAVCVLVAMVYSGNFPDCYIEGKGLTTFKIDSEYAITALLLVSLYLLYGKREHFNNRVLFLIASSIACTALSEISFTAYLSVYGFANMVGHFSKLAAFYLIYRAILVTGLKDPFDLIFRDLKQAKEALQKAHDTLEERVRERTAELRASEEKYRALIESANDAVFIHEIKEDGTPGPFIEVNELACRRLGYSREEFSRLSPAELDDPRCRDRIGKAMERLLKYSRAVFETAQMAKDGRSIPVEVSTRVIEIKGKRLLFSLVRDITERKLAEETLHGLNRELRAISNCNQTLIRAEDEQALLTDICRIVCEEAGYRMAWVGYVENDDAKTIRPVAWAGTEDGYLEQAGLTWAETERGRGPSGTAILSGKSACIQDFGTDPQAAPWRENALKRGYRSSVAIPLKDENTNTFGILNIYSTKPNAFTPDEVRLMEELTGHLAFGIKVLRTRIERERAEQKTRELGAIVQSSGDAIIGKTQDGIITSWNRGAENIFGYTEREVAGKSVAILVPPGHEDDLTQILGRVKSGEYVNCHETVRRTKDGRDIPVSLAVSPVRDSEGRIVAMSSIARDITERKRAEEAFYEQQQVFRTLVENSPDIIARYDRNCRRIYVNPAYLKEARIPLQGLLATTPVERSPLPAASAAVLQNLLHKVLDSAVAEAVDVVWPKADNIDYWYNIYASPEFDREGRIVSVLTVSRDITGRKHAEEEIRKLNEELEQRVMDRTAQLEAANKELEAFAFSVSHDLRAPLRHIDGFLELLEKRVASDLDAKSRRYLDNVFDSTKRMATLIDDLLSFSRMGRYELSKMQVDLGVLVKEIIAEAWLETSGRAVRWLVGDLPVVVGDRAMLRVVLSNLLSNALKFTRPCPKAEIEIGCMAGERTETVIFVSDNGVGFDMKYADKLFCVFQRLHRIDEFEGTGIGLANARRIISRHGGRTWAEGSPNRGATFYFSLPQPTRRA